MSVFGSGAILLLFVTIQRLAELWWARQNEARLFAAGGIEYGAAHFPLLVALQSAWLAGMWLFAYDRAVVPVFLGLFVALQAARCWVLATLGRRWTVHVIVVPGQELVRRGPYRYMRHPNYTIIVGEIAVVPLALGLPIYALVFSILNAAVLAIRIAVEDAALATARGSPLS
jgi:methyltransferase